MTSAQTTSQFGKEHSDDVVTDTTAETHDRALAAVQRLLKVRGVRSYAVHTIGLKLFGNGSPCPLGQRRRHAPELIACGDAGRVVATVTVGSRSGCYLVSLRNDPNPQTVGSEHPEKVADLITTAQSEERA